MNGITDTSIEQKLINVILESSLKRNVKLGDNASEISKIWQSYPDIKSIYEEKYKIKQVTRNFENL